MEEYNVYLELHQFLYFLSCVIIIAGIGVIADDIDRKKRFEDWNASNLQIALAILLGMFIGVVGLTVMKSIT